MYFADRLTLDAPRRTREGYLVGRARAARTGVYDYAGSEIDPSNEHGLRDKAIAKVLRDDKTVFDRAAVQSFIGKPITNDHPATPVTADNWRDHARGAIMGALRDGDYVAFDYLLTDAAAIAAVDAGKRELSNGYGAELEFGQFTAPDGTICDARQSKITGGNHVALVDRGRAGPDCAIKDLAVCDALTADGLAELQATLTNDRKDGTMPHTLTIDGLQVPNVSDEAKACIEKLQGDLKTVTDAKAKVETDLATATTEKATLDAKVTTLEKQVADAKLTPAQLRDAAKGYTQTVDKAKALGVTVADDADEAAIRKAVVDAKIGEAAKDWSDEQIAASFATLTADTADQKVTPINPAQFADSRSVRDLARAAQY
jgi:hypothetical protein